MTQILDGKLLAQTMQAEIAANVAAFTHKHGLRPGLAAVLVGDNPASQIYVKNKRKACDNVNMQSWLHRAAGKHDAGGTAAPDRAAQLRCASQRHSRAIAVARPDR